MSNEHAEEFSDYIFADASLTQKLEQLQFSESSETEHGMVEGCDFLDCHFLSSRFVDC